MEARSGSVDVTSSQGTLIKSASLDINSSGAVKISGTDSHMNFSGQKKIQAAEIRMQEGAQTASNAEKPGSPTTTPSGNPQVASSDAASIRNLA
jgi:hypothetical protein